MENVTDMNFQEEVLDANTPVFIDFWAEWCMPCKRLGPIYEDVSKKINNDLHDPNKLENKKPVKFMKANVEEIHSTIEKLKEMNVVIMHIPKIVLFSEGMAIGSIEGAFGAEKLEVKMKDLLKQVGY